MIIREVEYSRQQFKLKGQWTVAERGILLGQRVEGTDSGTVNKAERN